MRTASRSPILIVVLFLSLNALAATPVHKFSVSELESLPFQSLQQPAASTVALHKAVRQRGQLLAAYENGIQEVKTYHEPVLTRGSIGIALFRSASPGVVLISVGRMVNGEYQPEGLGSGVIIDARGYVLTNWHVVNGYTRAVVFLKPAAGADLKNARVYVAAVVAQDETKDLALLRFLTTYSVTQQGHSFFPGVNLHPQLAAVLGSH